MNITKEGNFQNGTSQNVRGALFWQASTKLQTLPGPSLDAIRLASFLPWGDHSSFSFRSTQITPWRVLAQRMALLAFCFRLLIPNLIHLVGSPQARVCLFPAWFKSRELVHIPDRISDNGRTHKAQDDFPIVKCVRLQAVPGSEHQADRGLGVNGEVWWLLSVFSRWGQGREEGWQGVDQGGSRAYYTLVLPALPTPTCH